MGRTLAANPETEVGKVVGKGMAEAFAAQNGVIRDPLLQQWVDRVGSQLTEHSSQHAVRVHFLILNTAEINAFTLPGGYVFVTRGLLDYVRSPDELAGVMAHELGHVAHDDPMHGIEWEVGSALALRYAPLPHSTPATIAEEGVLLAASLHFSRKTELNADQYGIRLATGSGYDPAGLVQFLQGLGGGVHPSIMERYFATHPPDINRIHSLERTTYMDPKNGSLQETVGLNLVGRHRPAAAVPHFRAALRAAPDPAAATRLQQELDAALAACGARGASPSGAGAPPGAGASPGATAGQEPRRQPVRAGSEGEGQPPAPGSGTGSQAAAGDNPTPGQSAAPGSRTDGEAAAMGNAAGRQPAAPVTGAGPSSGTAEGAGSNAGGGGAVEGPPPAALPAAVGAAPGPGNNPGVAPGGTVPMVAAGGTIPVAAPTVDAARNALGVAREDIQGRVRRVYGVLKRSNQLENLDVTLRDGLLGSGIFKLDDPKWLALAVQAYGSVNSLNDLYAQAAHVDAHLLNTVAEMQNEVTLQGAAHPGTTAAAIQVAAEARQAAADLSEVSGRLERSIYLLGGVLGDLDSVLLGFRGQVGAVRFAAVEAALLAAREEIGRGQRRAAEAQNHLAMAQDRVLLAQINRLGMGARAGQLALFDQETADLMGVEPARVEALRAGGAGYGDAVLLLAVGKELNRDDSTQALSAGSPGGVPGGASAGSTENSLDAMVKRGASPFALEIMLRQVMQAMLEEVNCA